MMVKRIAAVVLSALVGLGVVSCSSEDNGQDSDNQQVSLTALPANLDWDNLNGIDVPTGDEGPTKTSPARFGYDSSPQGAVLAAINGQAQLAVTDDSHWADMSRLVIAPGQGRDQWAQQRSLMTVEGSVPDEDAASFEGFRITDYDEKQAVVVLAVDYPDVGLAAYPVQLARLSSDWKLVLPSQGDELQPQAIDSLDEFTSLHPKEKK